MQLQQVVKKGIFGVLLLSSIIVSAQCSIFPGSTLIDNNGETFLKQCFGNNVPTRGELLYRGTVDGLNASAFHSKCDGKGATITFIKVEEQNEIFGGYNPQSWSSSDQYNNGEGAFLFNITHGFHLKQNTGYYSQYQTYNSSYYGPTFGGGHDLYISQDFSQIYTNPYSYENPNVYGYSSLLGNLSDNYYYYYNNARIVEIEVYATEPAGITVSGPTTLCYGSSSILTAKGGVSYLWSNGSTNSSISVDKSGTYSVAISTSDVNCPAITYSKTITVRDQLFLNSTQTNSSTPEACNGTVALIPSGGTTPYSLGSGISLIGTEMNTNLVSFGGSNAIFNPTIDGLQMRGTNGDWTNFVTSSKEVVRYEGAIFQGKIKVGDMSNLMIGWHDETNNTYYTAMSHAFYVSGNYFYIYEHGQYMGYIGNYNANEWIEFKIELQSVGAKYYIKTANDTDWNLVSTTHAYSDSNLKMGVSFYGYDYSNYYYYSQDYLTYNERQSFYTKDWNNGVVDNPSTTDLCAGTYVYTISDANGCLATKSVTITDNIPLEVSISKVCRVGEESFDLNTEIIGGVAPFTFNWAQPVTALNNPSVSIVGNGKTAIATVKSTFVTNRIVNYNATFSVDVTDATGKVVTANITIASSKGAMGFNTKNGMTINPACGNSGANGSIYFNNGGGAFGGAGTLIYEWFNSENVVAGTKSNLVSAPAGNYILKTTDVNGCSALTPVFNIPSSMIVFQESIVKPTAGKTDGSICINNISGGVAPYSYSWTYPDVFGSNNCLLNVGSVNQYFKIKDKNGCFVKKAISTKSMLLANEDELTIDNEGGEVVIYPNPTSDKLNISTLNYTSEFEGKFEIYSVQGQILSQGVIIAESVSQHDMIHLSPGIYYVKVIFGDDQQIFNVVKQ